MSSNSRKLWNPSAGKEALAVIHDPTLYVEAPELHRNAELASVNFHSHFIVSGLSEGLKRIENFLKAKEIVNQRLLVAFAFHSSYLDPAAALFTEFLKAETFHPPMTGLLSCLTGRDLSFVDPSFFWDAIRQPVDFRNAVRELEREEEPVYIDLGPSGTLANFVKYNAGGESVSRISSILNPFQKETDNLDKLSQGGILRRQHQHAPE